MGVDHVVDLGEGDVIESVKPFLKAKGLKGVDVLYDPVGGKLTKESMKLLNWGAHILVIGFASGEVPVIPANIALVKVVPLHLSQILYTRCGACLNKANVFFLSSIFLAKGLGGGGFWTVYYFTHL